MPYSDFTLKKTKTDLQLKIIEQQNLFADIEEVKISDILSAILEENVPLALAINTEKARSELIISNILVELRKLFHHKISLFSGIEFNVDKDKDLNGRCDFIISCSPEQLLLNAPLIAIVEAKNENIIGGLGPCIAEMVAAKIFNEQEHHQVKFLYGAVTSGNTWKFLKLDQQTIYIDLKDYDIEKVNKIMGILAAMVEQKA